MKAREEMAATISARVNSAGEAAMISFGPVPSRRLGRSLGINNIPPKVCSYSCVYCQLGRTTKISVDRQRFYSPERILDDVRRRVGESRAKSERIDYVAYVPDGEPTLDINLGKEITLLRQMEIPIAALTNASLIWQREVKEALHEMDLVSIKVDAVSEDLWRKINRPHTSLRLEKILDGIVEFSEDFRGITIAETMLMDGLDYDDEIDKIADFLGEVKLNKSYIAIPTRPPAEGWVKPAKEELINQTFNTFAEKLGQDRVEYLIGYEGNAFASTGNVEQDLLSITSVHPMRKEGIKELLRSAEADWNIVEKLISDGKLIELEYQKHTYFMRKLPSRMKPGA